MHFKGKKILVSNAIMHEPTKDPNVPYNVIPPDNPCGTDLKKLLIRALI